MEYFLIEEEMGNKVPYNINKNRTIDIRQLTRENINEIPMWNVVQMDFPIEGFFPDLLCSPWIMVSKTFMEVIKLYQTDIVYRYMKLWCVERDINVTYFAPILQEINCLSNETQYNHIKNRVTELVLNYEKIKNAQIFKIKGYDRKCIVGRMDFVESLLRRKVRGIRLEQIKLDYGDVKRSNYERLSD